MAASVDESPTSRICLRDLSDDVRAFLKDALNGGGITIADENGRTCGGIIPYRDRSPDEQQLQAKVERLAAERGIIDIDFILFVDE